MTPLERAEQLKAARRAELAKQAEEADRREAERQALSDRNLLVAVASFLGRNEAAWMAEFQTRVDVEDHGNPPDRHVYFELPGHEPLFLRFAVASNHFGPEPQTWEPSYQRDGHRWYRQLGNKWEGFVTLADALIATELPPAGEPGVFAREEPNRQVDQFEDGGEIPF